MSQTRRKVDAAAERGAQQGFGILAAGARLAAEVEARGAQALAAERSVSLGGREAHDPIMNRSRAPLMPGRAILAWMRRHGSSIESNREPERAERVASRPPTV